METQQPTPIASSYTRLGWYQYACLFVWVFNIYSEIPFILPGNKSLPAFLLLFFLPFIWPLIKSQVRAKHLLFPIGLTVIALYSVLAKGNLVFLTGSAFKLMQYFYSLCLCMCTYLLVTNVEAVRLRRFLFWFSIAIVVGCYFERIGVLSGITNAYRAIYRGTNYGGEIDIDREVFISGFVRPYFFTSEPSLVGLGFFGTSTAWAMLNTKPKLDVGMILCGFVLLFILGSPAVFLSPLLIVMIAIVKYKLRVLKIGVAMVALISVVIAGYQLEILNTWLEPFLFRFSAELMQEGTSMYARIYVPYLITLPKILQTYTWWGVGYGNHGLINEIFGYSYQLDEDEILFIRGSNAFVNFFTYMGLLGSILTFRMIYWFGKKHQIKGMFLVFCFLFFAGQIIGTFATPRFWCFVMLFCGCVFWVSQSSLAAVTDAKERIS